MANRGLAGKRQLNVLFASAEVFPLAKSGGLGDVCGALPQALNRLGAKVEIILPGYECALDQIRAPQTVRQVGQELRLDSARLIRGLMPDSDLPVWLLDCPTLYKRRDGLYQDGSGREWPDNAVRFGAFSHAIAGLARGWAGEHFAEPDIVHCNDWHTGPAPLLLSRSPERRAATVFTIHNMAYQGLFPAELLGRVGLPPNSYAVDGLEFYGQISYLKAGLAYADHLTTVSPTYAREILTPQYGHGMEGFLARRANRLTGILNGIDNVIWNPERDPYLPARFNADDLSGKARCKQELQRELGLTEDANIPLLIVVNRLTEQKMADVVVDILPRLFQSGEPVQIAVLGQGDRNIEDRLRLLAMRFAGRLAVRIGYDEPPAHRLHAGGDLLLHGSRFEPCGLVQLYAMRYGTPPIVRHVGGLADTVVHASEGAIADGTATGVAFDHPTGEDMLRGIADGLRLYRNATQWRRIQSNAMRLDFGWERSARRYLALYRSLAAQRLSDTVSLAEAA